LVAVFRKWVAPKKFDLWAAGVGRNCSADLQIGVLSDIVAIDADLEIGATTGDFRILKETHVVLIRHFS